MKLTEKQRETLERLALRQGEGYVGLPYVRPNTWRSLVGAGLVAEDGWGGGFKLSAEGLAVVGIHRTYLGDMAEAESLAYWEQVCRGNAEVMRQAEIEQLRDSQVLTDPHGKRHGVVGTELAYGLTRLWLVDLERPTLSPKWIDTDPRSMTIFFAEAEGFEAYRQSVEPVQQEVADILNLIDNPPTARELDQRRTAEALEGEVEPDDGYVLIGEVPRERPAVEGVTLNYWVVPTGRDRLSERHALLGPYRNKDLADRMVETYTEDGKPCEVIRSVDRPTLTAPPYAVGDPVLQLDGTPAKVFEVVGETVVVVTGDGEHFEHDVDELLPVEPVLAPLLCMNLRSGDRFKITREGSEHVVREARRQLFAGPWTVWTVAGEEIRFQDDHDTVLLIPAPGDTRTITLTLAEYIDSVSATLTAARRTLLGRSA